jgi:SAM-dependent methyltransferase
VTETVKTFYDELASNYHLIFEDWEASIKRQAAVLGPILERELSATKLRILDCACGTGTQTVGLASRGYRVTACDLSSAAVKRMCVEASQRRLDVQGFVADLLDLTFIPEGVLTLSSAWTTRFHTWTAKTKLLKRRRRFEENYDPVGCLWPVSEITMHWFARSQLCRAPLSTQMTEDDASFIKCGTGSMIVATHFIFT